MAQNIINENEVLLNSVKYRIKDFRESSIPRFHAPVRIGKADYANEITLDNWIISEKQYIGKEDMDESVDTDRCWWTNCITKYPGHTLLPRKATSISLGSITIASAATIANGNMEAAGSWTGGAQSAAQAHWGSNSWLVSLAATPASQNLATWSTTWRGKKFTASGWIYNGTSGTAYIQMSDGVGSTSSTTVGATSAWTHVTVTHTVDNAGTYLNVILVSSDNANKYFDDVEIGSPVATAITAFANFNSNQYLAYGQMLLKLAADRASYSIVHCFPATITALIPSVNSCLYIYLGDTIYYRYMSTAEAFTQTNVTDATKGVQWNDLLWKMDADGNWWYTATPNSATPTWTSQNGITDIASQVQKLFVGRDASGNPVIYAATKSIFKVWDNANNKWLDTEVKLPSHPNGGKGACYWNAAHYLSYGLGITKYVTGDTATKTEVGLNRDDGLPAEYNGEIVCLLGESGSEEMFALVDASQVTGTQLSGVYGYDGQGWTCWWAGPSEVIDHGPSNWNELVDPDVTASGDLVDTPTGYRSQVLTVAAGCGAGDILATSDAAGTLNLSKYDTVSVWLYSSVALSSGDLQLLLDDTALCASPLESINIPAISANTWALAKLTLASPASDTAIISVGIKMVVDKGAFTLKINRMEAVDYDGVMHDAIVTALGSTYALYWDCGGAIYYIDIPRGISNPTKLTTQNYAQMGIWLSPWFNAGSAAYDKIAKSIISFSQSLSTTETAALMYRINKTYTDLDTGWTLVSALNLISDNTEKVSLLGSGAGISFNTIQLRLNPTRKTTTTITPDIQAIVLSYTKNTGLKRAWNFTIILDNKEPYVNNSAKKHIADIGTAYTSGTFLPFVFREDTTPIYVRVSDYNGWKSTGRNWSGEITLALVEV